MVSTILKSWRVFHPALFGRTVGWNNRPDGIKSRQEDSSRRHGLQTEAENREVRGWKKAFGSKRDIGEFATSCVRRMAAVSGLFSGESWQSFSFLFCLY